jgi:hypothetical protein
MKVGGEGRRGRMVSCTLKKPLIELILASGASVKSRRTLKGRRNSGSRSPETGWKGRTGGK